MRWPRGRYNGERIVGFNVKMEVDLTRWWRFWLPGKYVRAIAIGPLLVRCGLEYRTEEPRDE